MNRLSYISMVSLTALLCACASNKLPPSKDAVAIENIQIPSKFDAIPITQDNFLDEANKCIPSAPLKKEDVAANILLEKMKDTTRIQVYRHTGSANYFYIENNAAICINSSTASYPIFAAEVFESILHPSKQVPLDVALEWNKKIALLLSQKGRVLVGYKLVDPVSSKEFIDAIEFRLFPDKDMLKLYYKIMDPKPANYWKNLLDTEFSHPNLSSMEMTLYGDPKQNIFVKSSLLGHRNHN